jgi:hypothetical protein
MKAVVRRQHPESEVGSLETIVACSQAEINPPTTKAGAFSILPERFSLGGLGVEQLGEVGSVYLEGSQRMANTRQWAF